MRYFHSFLLFVILVTLTSCNNAGLQGTSIPSKFDGVQQAIAISPTTVRLSWPLQARFSEYRIYQRGFSVPRQTETFATANVTGLDSETFYDFSVSGVTAVGADEIGFDKFLTVKTMGHFTGISNGGVSAQANGSVEVSWIKNGEGVTYKVFSKKESETWDLTTPAATAINKGSAIVTNLPTGAKYCFWAMAFYGDDTFEPLNMSEAYLNSKAQCVLVQSQLANLPTVKMQMASVGNFPWFWTSGGDSSYTTEIFEKFTDIRLATVTGNDYFRSIIPISPGLKNIYAKVTAPSGAVTIVEVGMDGVGNLKKPLVRALEGSGAVPPLTPRLVNNGLGIQELGRQVVVGDFNCDGLPDVAISAPGATPIVTDQHFQSFGAIVVYYGYDAPPGYDSNGNPVDPAPALKLDGTPNADASFPDPQLIYYPGMTSNSRLGQALAVGNVNGDCFSRYTDLADPKANRIGLCDDLYTPAVPPANINKIKNIYKCDDLAIAANDGSVYVVFGDPVRGLVTGSGGSSNGLNETTCDPGSFKCRPVKIKDAGTKLVNSITFGDYNNDGFDDLAIGITTNTNPVTREVQVLRGSRMGIFPKNSAYAFPPIVAETLVSDVNATLTDGTFAGKSNAENFGGALGTAFNSRVCVNGTYTFRATPYPGETSPAPLSKGYDFTKCDDLVIGVSARASGRGSVISCKAQMPTVGDLQKISAWTCQESYPTLSAEGSYITVAGYGFSILGVPNQNGYPLTNIIGVANTTPNVNGALFVGAPTSTVNGNANAGVVFGYYVTPRSNDYTTGGISAILAPSEVVTAINRVACDSRNTNATTGALKHCENQVIHTNPAEYAVQFGYALGTIADIETISRGLPSLGVSAPFRQVTGVNGQTVTNGGVVYLFKPDVSALGYEGATRIDSPQLSDNDATNCSSNCTWYSGGVNPFGASIIYAKDLSPSANFGLGGVAGADFNGDGSGDLIAGAPFNSIATYYNGAAYVYHSTGNFASAVSEPNKTINVNFSKELNYHFERAKVIGDLNGDGYQDVVTQISVGTTIELAIFYGSANGLITTPAPSRNPAFALAPLKLVVDLDPGFGTEFYRLGSVNGDAYDDIMIIGSKGTYIYYGSSGGLVYSSVPSVSPVGQNALSFARGGDPYGISFHNTNMAGKSPTSSLSISSFDPSNRSVTYGDFNGDGYSDFAVATDTKDIPSIDVQVGSILYTTANRGRVFVFYGSSDGPQTNRINGRTLLQDSGGAAADIVVQNPCTATTPAVCKVQMLLSTEPAGGTLFGWSLAGLKSLDSPSSEFMDELVVADPEYNSTKGRVYLYKGSTRGLKYTPDQKIEGAKAGEAFGYSVVAPGDINGDGVSDLVVSAPRPVTISGVTTYGTVYAFYGGQVGATYAFAGAANIASTDFFGAGVGGLPNNAMHATAASLKAQRAAPDIFSAPLTGVVDGFGYGLGAVGDLNSDGYADVIVNVPGKQYDLDEVLNSTGAFVVFYGGPLGLRIDSTPTTTPRCYGGSAATCEPALIYLPQREQYEYSYLSGSPAGDINGDGIQDVLLASPGRSHPSGKAFSTGVVYVLY
ncbi:MAG: hypothetical protein ACKOX6_16140 [Bdellovibrio sp.]